MARTAKFRNASKRNFSVWCLRRGRVPSKATQSFEFGSLKSVSHVNFAGLTGKIVEHFVIEPRSSDKNSSRRILKTSKPPEVLDDLKIVVAHDIFRLLEPDWHGVCTVSG